MSSFRFKEFDIRQSNSAMKVGTDAMILGSICTFPKSPKNILDIGTGTGVLSLMLAQRFEPTTITAVEIDQSASDDALFNFSKSPFSSKLNLVNKDIRLLKPGELFDAIISNPPFFENSSKSESDQRNLARHTDNLAYQELLQIVASNLTSDGLFWVIVPYESFHSLCDFGKENAMYVSHSIIIYGKPNKPIRVVIAFSKTAAQSTTSELTIRDDFGKYTEAYIELTRQFHAVDLSDQNKKKEH
ncbi:MAG: methyltransferase [Fluviicola sp.]|nr:methyltransferase [Fluviicola sp.]